MEAVKLIQSCSVILFDLGNVVIDLEEVASYRAFAELGGVRVEELLNLSASSGIFPALEKGQITEAAFREGLRKLLDNQHLADQQLDTAWNAMLLDIDPELITVLLKLKEYKELMVLSNTNSIHERAFHKTLSGISNYTHLNQIFNQVYFSHDIGARKPDREAWQYIMDLHPGIPAGEYVFLDDKPENLQTASSLGLKTIRIAKPRQTLGILQQFLQQANETGNRN